MLTGSIAARVRVDSWVGYVNSINGPADSDNGWSDNTAVQGFELDHHRSIPIYCSLITLPFTGMYVSHRQRS
jgi:hypothetical protein